MPLSKRTTMIHFGGDDLTSGTSPEVDASSFTDAIIHCTRGSSVEVEIHLEAAPVSFDTAADWHRLHRTTGSPTNLQDTSAEMTFTWTTSMPDGIAVHFPSDFSDDGQYLDLRVPRRFRIVKSQNLTALAIELKRRVA